MTESKPYETVEAFLEVEFLHSLGSYFRARNIAAEELNRNRIADAGGALRRTQELNALLCEKRDHPKGDSRHPNPCEVLGESTGREKLEPHETGLLLDKGAGDRLQRITDFYSTGIAALDRLLDPPLDEVPRGDDRSLEQLAACLFWDRDPSSSAHSINELFQARQKDINGIRRGPKPGSGRLDTDVRIRRRIEAKRQRFIERRRSVEKALEPRLTHQREWETKFAAANAAKLLKTNLDEAAEGSVTPGFVLQCFVAAHLRLHSVEYFLSKPFKEAMEMNAVERDKQLWRLREAEALNTFVYAVCRSLPWIFARDRNEMRGLIRQCKVGFGVGAPEGSRPKPPVEASWKIFGGLWRSQRIASLALHRRAFGHALRDQLVPESFNDTAFKDFHKLQRHLRVQRRMVLAAEANRKKPKFEKAAEEQTRNRILPQVFNAGLGALSETHVGDLYRSDHAHHVALEHFCDGHDRLENLSKQLLEAPEGGDARLSDSEGPDFVAEELRDSRWRIHLMMSKGKGFYEAGNLKRSVKWLLKSWSALLVLICTEKPGDGDRSLAKTEEKRVFPQLTLAIDTLREIKNDPDFSKEELVAALSPIVDQFERLEIPPSVQVIASEILLRLGHTLYVLRLHEGHDLAFRCLQRAHALDPHSTLVAADRLKIEIEDESYAKKAAFSEGRQWPFGRGNPDQIIRMIEYHLLLWVAATNGKNPKPKSQRSPGEEDREVARRLLTGLLTHTDSINVRQSQVYRYLMQPRQAPRRIGPTEGWEKREMAEEYDLAIEFVCLRRYSSFFPFVPRPSAFRSVGGGYLLRLHHHDKSCPQPFGIAIDPGPDFIDNLYRCGFGLGDIDMIILTHDHPDHSVDLDPVLALLGYRMKQGDTTFVAPNRDVPDAPVRRLLIVGNESVAQRLRFFNKPHVSSRDAAKPRRPDAVHVVSFDEFGALQEQLDRQRESPRKPEIMIPREMNLKPVVSIRHNDSFGLLAYGFRLSLGENGPSIGFTGDTGGFVLEQDSSSRWRIQPKDDHGTLKLIGDNNWREHWADLFDVDVLIPHVSGLPLSQLLVLANDGKSTFAKQDPRLAELLSQVWNGLDESARSQVGFAFWLPEDEHGIAPLPLEDIKTSKGWPKGHLYLIGLLEFARAYQEHRRGVNKPGLFLIGELREELGSLRGKIAYSLNTEVFESNVFNGSHREDTGCRALTTDVGLRLMITRKDEGAQVRVLCSICDLDNDRTRSERFHDPGDVRDVSVKGENEGIYYTCSNHDPLRYAHPVFIERIERYDVFSDSPIH
ncbi:MAG TPA: hypothetical protein VFP21_11615 [Solirubrobacterales bacterium]|nr:hypothetical protein [Solirubrobacterales bacterium]